MNITRRAALMGLSSAFAVGRVSFALADAPTEKRFVVVLLRGALVGMQAVVPYGDPHLAAWRPGLIPPQPGRPGGMLDLGGFYGLNPALPHLHAMYAAGEMLPIHAVAGPYRTRSHFEAQDYLQLGVDHGMTSGWLNRVLQVLPDHRAAKTGPGQGLAVGMSVPLLLRGPVRVGGWSPRSFATPNPDLYARIVALNAADPITGPALAEGLKEKHFADRTLGHPMGGMHTPAYRGGFPAVAMAAGKLLAAATGPRIAAMELEGWDTHVAQLERLHAPLAGLDAGLAALKQGMGDAWGSTAVLVVTEFGRTVRMNGTHGTDHGTATIAFLLGGAVAGGKVRANWPGLAQGNLFQNRDLQPTADVRSVAKGVLAAHLGLSSAALAQVFPDSAAAAPMAGLLRATG